MATPHKFYYRMATMLMYWPPHIEIPYRMGFPYRESFCNGHPT